ncbi:MAG TPA: hypothetical protein VGN11_13175 [Candidatus Baltobacteraceae bacterium]|jgi:hypothetical protein|nr:hypothetical protein [Candidatus Baltobacteraceae bacterium]
MIRYYAIATGLVLAIVVFSTAWVNRELIRIKIASVDVAVSPKPAEPLAAETRSPTGLRGDAPWALSALPDCVRQSTESRGTHAYVLAHLPAGVSAVPSRTTLRYGPCTISVGDGEAYVTRGPDRLRIPPHIQFYRAPGVLVLVRSSGSNSDLRIYDALP